MPLESRRDENPDNYVWPDDAVMERIGVQSRLYSAALVDDDGRAAVIYDDRVQLLAALHFIEKAGLRENFMQFGRLVLLRAGGLTPEEAKQAQSADPQPAAAADQDQ